VPAVFLITHAEGRTELRPTPSQVRETVAAGLGCSVLALFGAGYCFGVYSGVEGWLCFGPFCALLSVIWLVGGIDAWRRRRAPLVVESSGRVSYGSQEVCAEGSVRAVVIRTHYGEDAPPSYSVRLRVAGGEIDLPDPYFASEMSMGGLEAARETASALANVLGVEIVGDEWRPSTSAPDEGQEQGPHSGGAAVG
jgi:hypothetical protein